MKFKITILTENDKPVSALNGVSLDQVKVAWQALFNIMTAFPPSENHDKATVLSVELVEDEDENQ